MKEQLHGTPITDDNNLLDRLSKKERFDFCYSNFFFTEKSLVENEIIVTIPHGKVLNVGCGQHGGERGLFPTPDYQISGVDVSEEALRILHGKKLYDGLYKADISSLPFTDRTFDIVYLRLILHHLIYPKNILAEGLQECFRVLKYGGVLALIEPNSWHPVGALMNIAHRLGIDQYIHGTDDDVALSPRKLRRMLSRFSSDISMHAVTFSWRRLPVFVQSGINRLQSASKHLIGEFPYFAHTLMIIAHKK